MTDRKIRLSHSTITLLNTCERKFQLEKLLSGFEKEESEHFSAGHCFGAGVASYLAYQDKDKAIFAAWFAYWPEINTEKKNQSKIINALIASFPKLDDLLQNYEMVFYNKGGETVPAAELSFRINLDATYYFVGYIDAVLRHRYTGKYVIFEAKHTGIPLHDLEPLYKNSGQALGYSIALDRIVGSNLSSYGVLYFVAQLGQGYTPNIHTIPFQKTLLDRLNWFMTLGLDVQRLTLMEEMAVYPKRGESCLKFNKPCRHFGTCGLHSLDRPAVYVEDTVVYDFVYDLEDLITDHVKRIQYSEVIQAAKEVEQVESDIHKQRLVKPVSSAIFDLDLDLDTPLAVLNLNAPIPIPTPTHSPLIERFEDEL